MNQTFSRVLAAALIIALLNLTACTSTSEQTTDAGLIVSALEADNRTVEERERDTRSKPETILGVLNLQPGDHAADILGGGGYYAVLMANIVGEQGEVILQNNTPYTKFVEKQNNERFTSENYPNIQLLRTEVDDLQLGTNHLDAALMVMSFHDLYYVAPERGWNDTDIDQFLAQVNAALKPGGRLVIVDHAAQDGTGKEAVASIHRIDEAFVQQEIERNGFRLIKSVDVLRNPDDERTKMVFDKSIRGKTDRFVLVFERS